MPAQISPYNINPVELTPKGVYGSEFELL